MTIREHPIMIVGRVFKYMVITAVPILGFRLPSSLFLWWEAAILILGVLLHRSVEISADGEKMVFKKGVIFKKEISSERAKISAVSVKIFRPFRWAKLKIYLGTGKKREEISLVLLSPAAVKFCSGLFGNGETENFSELSIAGSSFFLANSFAGAVTAATFLVSIFRVLGSDLRKSLIETLEDVGAAALIYKTPISFMIIAVVLGSWLLSFAVGVLRYKSFERTENKRFIRLTHGVILESIYILNKEDIVYTAGVSTMPSALFKFRSEFSVCSGFCRKAGFYPLSRPKYKETAVSGGFRRGRIFSYVWKPILVLFLLSVGFIILSSRVTLFISTLRTVYIFSAAACLWRIIFSIAASFFCGIGDGGTHIRTTDGFLFYDCFVDTEKISAIRLFNTAFSFGGLYTATFYNEAGKGGKLKLRYIKKSALKEILRKIKLDCCKNK